jgi:ADP-heptose:LPS heptosyltransferase
LFSIQLEDSDLPKNANVWDLSHLIHSWSDTYDIFAESDLVITSCTATAHLAGAMGTQVIVLTTTGSLYYLGIQHNALV